MTAPLRLAAFAAMLATAFGAAAAAGSVLDPDVDEAPKAQHDEGGHGGGGHGAAAAPDADQVRGLAIADAGLRLVVEDGDLRRDRRETLRFAIENEQGEIVRDLDLEHTKRMHVIVVRRDLAGFQHLHPRQRPDGGWELPVRLPDAGVHRLFADFSHDGQPHTLAADLRVDGPAEFADLPAPSAVASAGDGYEVRLDEPASGELRFAITRDGRPVDPEPYLGAEGHLVALREGDLAFLHVHPTGAGPSFAATFPTAGRYRLFLQFRDEGRVRTAAFTHEVPR